MKKIMFVFLSLLLVLCGCSQPSSEPYEGARSVKGDTVFQADELNNGPLYLRIENSGTKITIENPDETATYGFVFAPFDGKEKINNWSNGNVTRTGSDIFYWKSTASPMTMSPSDFGLGGDTVVSVFKATSLSLGEKLVSPVFTAENGNRYYIADYAVNISDLNLGEKTNVLFFVANSSGGYSSGLFDENGNPIDNNNEPVDLTKYENDTLHFKLFTFRNNEQKNAVEYAVYAQNPTDVKEDSETKISSPTSIVFSTTDTTSEYVAEIKIRNPENYWYSIGNAKNGNQDISLYTDLSYSYDKESSTGTYVVYIGKIDETLRFNTWVCNRSSGEICEQSDVMSITLRKLEETDKRNILELDLSSPASFDEDVLTYEVNLSDFENNDNIFIKFIGNDDPVRNAHITLESEWIIEGSVHVSMNSDTSYGTWGDYITGGKASIRFDKDIVNIIFNSATISISKRNENAEKSITITVDINPYDVNETKVDIDSLLENGLTDVSPDDVISITGMSTDNLYGFTLGEDGSDEWKYYTTETLENIIPNAFVINTEGEEFSFSLSEVNCKETIKKISFFTIPQVEYESRMIISKTSEPLYTTGNLSIYGGYYDIDMTRASDYGIENSSSVMIVEDSRFSGDMMIRRRNAVLGYNGSSELMSLTEDHYKVVSMWLVDTSKSEKDQPYYQYLSLTTPETCTDKGITVTSGDAVIIPESNKARVIEYSFPSDVDNTVRIDSLSRGNQIVRNTEYSLEWDADGNVTYKMYVPPMNEDGVITFPWVSYETGEIVTGNGTVMLRAFDEEDKMMFTFETLSDSDLAIEIKTNPNGSYVPVIVDSSSVSGGLSGVNATTSHDGFYYNLVVNYETEDGRQYTEWLEKWENGENFAVKFRTGGSNVWFINLLGVWPEDYSTIPEDATITLTFVK